MLFTLLYSRSPLHMNAQFPSSSAQKCPLPRTWCLEIDRVLFPEHHFSALERCRKIDYTLIRRTYPIQIVAM